MQKWAVLGQKIVETSFAITAAEKKAFETLRDEVRTSLHYLPLQISSPVGHNPCRGHQTECQGHRRTRRYRGFCEPCGGNELLSAHYDGRVRMPTYSTEKM